MVKTSIKYLCSCLLCKTEMYSCGLKLHYGSTQCKLGTTFVKKWKDRTNRELNCKFCDFVGKNQNSIAQHESRCKHNPERINLDYLNSGKNFNAYREQVAKGEIKHLNQFSKAESLGLPKPEVSKTTREKISQQCCIQNEIRWSDPENVEKQKISMRRAVENNPESYNSGNRGRVKQIEYDGIKFHGQWEVDFYKWCKEFSIEVQRNTKWFSYEWNGKRKYCPDFYLPLHDLYIEIKGYETERDAAKWEHFPHRLRVLRKMEIKKIRKKEFKLE